MIRELVTLYAAFASGRPSPLPALPIQYADYAAWQRQWLQGARLEEQLNYWRRQLQGVSPLDLPTDHSHPAVQTYVGKQCELTLPLVLSQQLAALSQQQGVTLFMTLLAAFQLLLSRYSGQSDIAVGSLVANRTRTEVENVIGFFVNTLVLRTDLGGNPRFTELLERVREVCLGAYAHQDISFEKIVEALQPERDLSRSPLFQVLFVLQNAPQAVEGFMGLTLQTLNEEKKIVPYDLLFSLEENEQGLQCYLKYNTDLFEARSMHRLLHHWQTLLQALVTEPSLPLSSYSLLTARELESSLASSSSTPTPLPEPANFSYLFLDQVRRTPDAIAASDANSHLSYLALAQHASRLTTHLRAHGAGPEQLVALLLPRSLDLLTAVLACFLTGAAYLPLDPHTPTARLRRLLEDARPCLLLAVSPDLPALPDLPSPLLSFGPELFTDPPPDSLLPTDTDLLATLPTPLSGEQLAYVIYTSGSTGTPKGAMLTQRGMLNHLFAKITSLELSACDTLAFTASPTFDISVWQALAPLLVGARVQLFADDLTHDPSALLPSLARFSVSILEVVPSFLAAFLSQEPLPPAASLAALRLLVVTGEAFAPTLAQRWLACYPSCLLLNAYGPTECSDDVAQQSFPPLPESVRALSSLPIGSPLPNTQLLVLDPLSGYPVPWGLPGHLFIGGSGVGRGYLGEPGRTALAFQPHPYAKQPGERLYATGDRARWLEDGSLQFLGRLDRQVKLRGFRLELGEIEAVLCQHPAIRQAVARLVQTPTPQLLAYLVGWPGQKLAEAEILKQVYDLLAEQLPAYMHPAHIFLLETLPLTAHGKLDERALPLPTSERPSPEISRSDSPRTPLQELLAGLWQDVLQLPRVGIHDSFFALGGHSLLATHLLSRLRSCLVTEVSLRTLFQAPTIAALAQQIEEDRHEHPQEPLPPLRPLPRRDLLPLSFAQQRLWFLEQLHPGGTAYTIPLAAQVHGPLQVRVLMACFQEVIRRHESLRTRVLSRQGEPFQYIEPASQAVLSWRFVSLEALAVSQRQTLAHQLVYDEIAQPFDLAQGPLMRIVVLRLNQEDHILQCTLHHIISDGWSNGLLMRELISLYPAFLAGKPSPLPELPIQYADYAVWQRQWLQGNRLDEQISYWSKQLQGVSSLDLPTDHPHPVVQTYAGAQQVLLLPAWFNEQLSALSRQQGVTLFMTLLAAFQLLLARYSGQGDVAVGTPIANRMHNEVESLIGFFANTLVLRTNLGGNPRFTELLGRVREVCLGAYAHQDVPFEKIVEVLQPERVPGRSPLFQVMFLFQDAIQISEYIDDLRISALDLESHTAKFDLALLLSVRNEGLHITAKYNTDLFEPATIERLLGHWQILLEGILAEPEQRVEYLPLLTEAERQKMLIDWNATQDSTTTDRCIHELFELQAARTPHAIALTHQETQLSYRELDRRANQMAHYLRSLGVGPEVPVGLCMKRAPEMFIGLLGILKAGGVYVPLDPAYPQERLAFMLQNSQAAIVLTHHQTDTLLSPLSSHITLLRYNQLALASLSQEPPHSEIQVDNAAYIIYTSGSTGQPKGVQVTHRGISSISSAQIKTFRVRPEHRVLQFASPSFDASISEIMIALYTGATLVLPPRERTLPGYELAALLNEQAITTLTIPPSLLSVMSPEMETSLQTLVVAGEACSAELAERWASRYNFINAYGPTETTICATMAPYCAGKQGTPAIGGPVTNVRTYILDHRMQPVAIGIPGELYIGGKGVARGYIHQADLTADRFVPDMFGGVSGGRLYRTGDLVRYRADGMIEYLGRIDRQVKLRGYRIELAEIEAILTRHASVREAVVVLRKDENDDEHLAAYLTLHDTAAHPGHSELYPFTKEQLPDYMIPAEFIVVPTMPLTPNGKIDRKQLANLAHLEYKLDVIEDAPRTPIEELIAASWCAVQKITHIGIYDNFFETGGHSLQITRLLARLRAALHIDLPPHSVFEAPTVAELAQQVEQVMRGEYYVAPLLPAPRTNMREIPLSYAQQRLWFLHQLRPDSPAYIISSASCLQGKIDLSILKRCFEEVVQRHEVLRTAFISRSGQPVQVVELDTEFQLPLIDLQLFGEDERRTIARHLARQGMQQPFNLEHCPLLRVHLFRLQEQEHVLLLAMHHIVTDGWSLEILVREVSLLYTAFQQKQPSPLKPLTIQYADFALWQRTNLQGALLNNHLAYWKRRLEGSVALELPTDYPRPAHYSDKGANYFFTFSSQLLHDILELSYQEGVTLFMTLFAVFQIMLARYTNQQDIVVGTDIANRTQIETEELIGFFVNLLALRTNVDRKSSFRSLLAKVREVVLDAYLHQDLPFDMLVDHLQLPRQEGQTPLVRVLFVLQNAPMSTAQLPGLTMQPFGEAVATSKFDLAVFFTERTGTLRGTVTYRADLFNAWTIARLMERYETLLRHILAQPDAIIDSLEMSTAEEKARNAAGKRIQRQQLHISKGERLDLTDFSV